MKDKTKWAYTSLRLKPRMLKQMKKHLLTDLGQSRNSWILLAIAEKLTRDKK